MLNNLLKIQELKEEYLIESIEFSSLTIFSILRFKNTNGIIYPLFNFFSFFFESIDRSILE